MTLAVGDSIFNLWTGATQAFIVRVNPAPVSTYVLTDGAVTVEMNQADVPDTLKIAFFIMPGGPGGGPPPSGITDPKAKNLSFGQAVQGTGFWGFTHQFIVWAWAQDTTGNAAVLANIDGAPGLVFAVDQHSVSPYT